MEHQEAHLLLGPRRLRQPAEAVGPEVLRKIVSGGQTGVDRAALRAAMARGLAVGGWCPPGRAAEDGRIPDVFPLAETPAERSDDAPDVARSQRTAWNVRDADGTLILRPAAGGEPDPGTRWTARCAEHLGKPLLVCDPASPHDVVRASEWIRAHRIDTLNVAGPSERTAPGIGAAAERFVRDLIAAMKVT